MDDYTGIDIFSGAGGMSVGAFLAGIKTELAVEIDKHAALTYRANHPKVKLINDDIKNINFKKFCKKVQLHLILYGGPPCQGFSTSNQKNRSKDNSNNWLFREYIRVVNEAKPEWLVFENVKGILETENGYFFDMIIKELEHCGYKISFSVLNAADFGVPQVRNRVFIVGSRSGINFSFPVPKSSKPITVGDAISDLPILNGKNIDGGINYLTEPQNEYQEQIRNNSKKSTNNLITTHSELVINRFNHIPQGGNWRSIPQNLMHNYKDCSRCHTGIYHRLKIDCPSIVIGNYRKNMLIHPIYNRGLSVREAARIQSFPDTFQFYGSIGYQQQQVGNSVPPLLAKAVFEQIIKY